MNEKIKNNEISEENLEQVNGGRLVVSVMHCCDEWRCKKDGSQCDIYGPMVYCNTCGCGAFCNTCQYCTYEKGLWLCNREK